MKYMGSKSRIAKHIVPIIQKYLEENKISTYVEPFCGGCNVIDKISPEIGRIAADKQHYLIEFLKYTSENGTGELPKDFVTREHYNEVRRCYNEKDGAYLDWYVGAIGFLASYNGRFFDGGYAGTSVENGKVRNYYDECKRNIEKQLLSLGGVIFIESDYKDLSDKVDLTNCLIYCDPPYAGTKQFSSSKGFNYEHFWQWCRNLSKNNIVLISEENAPEDFECIWQAPVKRTIKTNDKKTKIEKLFKYVGV